MLKVAIISYWHVHAKDYTQLLKERPERAEITCVWDEEEARGKEWAEKLGVDFESDYDKLLAREDVDAVVIVTPTNAHREVIVKAANAGKHIFTEKVLAATTSDCNAVAEAVKKNGVSFCISYPQRTTPEFLYAKEIADSGILGRISLLRVRNGHDGSVADWLPEYWYDGEKACGGVMMDLGCHPMYLSRWILGQPKSINSTFSYLTNRDVEDSAVCNVAFENGAVAIVESSFVSPCSPYLMELYGDKGSLFIFDGKVKLCIKEQVEKEIPVSELPAPGQQAIDQWLDACETGRTCEFGLDDAIGLTELMEGAYIAAREGRTVSISEIRK